MQDCLEYKTMDQIREELKRRLETARKEAEELWEQKQEIEAKHRDKERLVAMLRKMVDA